MKTVKHILDSNGGHVWSVSPDTSVYDALATMAEKEVGALLVMEDETLRGIITERDYARKVILEGRASKDIPVRDIMTERLLVVHPEQTVEECMAVMTEAHIRHLPVMVGDHPIAVVSMRDLVRSIISDKDQLIEQLENYISGR